jgi:hypothetical protein
VDQILRIRLPGGPPEGAKAVKNVSLSLITTKVWTVASSTGKVETGEKTLVVTAEGCRPTQQR